MAAARGQKALGALPQLVKSLRSDPVSGSARLRHLPSLRYTLDPCWTEEMRLVAVLLLWCLWVLDFRPVRLGLFG